jgi:hypothetical protein
LCCVALETNLALKDDELKDLRTRHEQLTAAAQVATSNLTSSAEDQSLPCLIEQMSLQIREHTLGKMSTAAAVAQAQAKLVFRQMNLLAMSSVFTKDYSDNKAIDLYAEAKERAPNVTGA